MKKYFVVLAILLSISVVAAEEIGAQKVNKPEIVKVVGLGKGIAISTTDMLDFYIVKIGMMQVKLKHLNQTMTKDVGLLWLDGNKYNLKNISIQQGTAYADVYLNNSSVGTISLVLVEKNETSIWTGKLTLHGKEYSIYILEGKRQFQRNELKEKVREYCDEKDENCVKIAKGIGNRFCEKVYDQSCREKISEFCEQNPDDPRCRAIAKNFCANNTEDIRCRDLLKEVCKTTPNDPRCLEYCEQNPELCKIHIKTEIKEKIRERLQRIEETRRVNKAMVQER